MILFCFIFISFYLASRDITGSHSFFAASLSTQSSSKESFLLTTGNRIVQFSPGYPKVTLLSELNNAVYLDVLFLPRSQQTVVFWADTYDNTIYRAFLTDNKLTGQEVVVTHGLSSISGLVVEWVGSNIYWCDKDSERIEVAHWDGSMRTTLMDQLNSPTSLVVDPVEGFLFWISEDKSEGFSMIERSYLDGSERWTVFSTEDGLVKGHTYVLAVFSEMRELCWLDNSLGYIYCSDYAGGHVRVLAPKLKATSVFTFAVTRDYIYWTDKLSRLLAKASHFDLDHSDTLTVTRPRIYDLKIISSHHQQSGVINVACSNGNGGCTHLCLRGAGSPTCRCPYGLKLSHNQRTCQEYGPILGFARRDKSDILNLVSLEDPKKWAYPPLKITNCENLSLAFDPKAEKLYRIEDKNIVLQSLDGTKLETLLTMDYFSPRSLAVDWQYGNLYIMSEKEPGRGLISVTTVSGASFTHLHWENIWTPGHFALDLKNMFLFWSHTHTIGNETELNIIEMSQLDGSNRQLFFTSDEPIKSMAVDTVGRRLCWLNPQKRLIFCKGYRPSSSHYSVPTTNRGNLTAITFYDNTLFCGNSEGQLYSVNMASSNETTVLLNVTSSLPFITIIPTKTDHVRKSNCDPNTVCLPGFRKAAASSDMKVNHYLMYTESGDPHTYPVDMPGDYPELFPGALFQVGDGDKVAALVGPVSIFFWVNQLDGAIYSVRRDGTNQSRLVSADGVIGGIEVDEISENLYWSLPRKGEIWVSRLDGSHPYVVHVGNHEHPSILTVSSYHGYLFWSSCGSQCSIRRSSLSGSNFQVLLDDLTSVADMAVDEQWLYWTSPDVKVIQKSDLNGQRQERLLESDKSFAPFSLSVENGIIYWSDLQHGGGSILKMNGSAISVLKRGISVRQLFILHEAHAPESSKSENPCGKNNGGCAQLCLYSSTNPGNSCYCSYGYLAQDNRSCQDYSAYLVFSNQNKLESINVDNPRNPNPPVAAITPLLNGTKTAALVFDPTRERIFFNDVYRKPYLFSIHPNGSGVRPELKDSGRTRHIEGLTLDPLGGFLLWTESFIPSIWSLIPEKFPQMVVALAAEDKPRGIVIHHCSRRLFWTNWNDRHPGIETCTLDRCSLSRRLFLPTHSNYPNALTLQNEHLFWTETSSKTKEFSIHSCKLDATHHRVHLRGRDANPFALVVLPSQEMLWTDFHNKRLCLSSPDEGTSGNACQSVRANLEKPMGLALVDSRFHPNDCSGSLGEIITEAFDYSCIGRSCNYSQYSNSVRNFSEDFVETGDQYNSFHKHLFVGAGVAGTVLILVTALLLIWWYYRRKQRNWCHLKMIAQKERIRQANEASRICSSQTNSLLEMDNVAFQKKDEQIDDEQCLILSKSSKDNRNIV